MKLLNWAKSEIRFWIWLFRSPNSYRLIESGVDRQSRRIIYDRHLDSAPPSPDEDMPAAEPVPKPDGHAED